MHPRIFALIGGIVMLAMGILALIPAFAGQRTADLPPLVLDTSYGLFLGIFPMNIVNKLALILFGAAGIAAANAPTTSLPASIRFSRWVFGVMGVLTILGLFTQTNTLYGYWPLFGAEVWTHGIFAALGAYFGFVLPSRAARDLSNRHLDAA
jgi:hypothetical protein